MRIRVIMFAVAMACGACARSPSEVFAIDLWLNRQLVVRCEGPTLGEVERCLTRWQKAAQPGGTP